MTDEPKFEKRPIRRRRWFIALAVLFGMAYMVANIVHVVRQGQMLADLRARGCDYMPANPHWLLLGWGRANYPEDLVRASCSGLAFYAQGQEVSHEDLSRLTDVKNLTVVNLAGTKIKDASLALLKKREKLEGLCLNDTSITDAGLVHLSGLKCLEQLHLDRTQITDASVESLFGMTKLQELHLTGTKVSPEGVARLKARLPRTRIVGP